MKVGVIADTHTTLKNVKKLKAFLESAMKDVDLIIHAGDIKSEEALEVLKNFKNIVIVRGNNDNEGALTNLNDKEILSLEGYKIGVTHGDGTCKSTLDNALQKFEGEEIDILIFGHSHKSYVDTKGNTLILNPGSPSRRRKERWYSYIVLDLREDGIDVELKYKRKAY